MSESHPPEEEDTSYFADSLEQDVNFTLDPNLPDYPSVESQFLDLGAIDLLDSVGKLDYSTSPSVPAGYGSNISLPTNAADGNKTPGPPGHLNIDFPDDLSHSNLSSNLLPDDVAAGSTVNSEPTLCAQGAGPGVEPAELRYATNLNSSQLPASDFTGLPRRRSRYFIQRSGPGPSLVFIPNSSALDPMDRWRGSPPEDEPASISAIMDAVRNAPGRESSRMSNRGVIPNAFRHYRRAPSTSSGDKLGCIQFITGIVDRPISSLWVSSHQANTVASESC